MAAVEVSFSLKWSLIKQKLVMSLIFRLMNLE